MMHRNQSVNTHQFSMVPRADIPRSGFKIESSYKTTFNSGVLVPIYVEEVLPGDSFSLKATMFARLATPIVPVMDNIYLDSFFFFVPNRLVWDNWVKFCGERKSPDDSIDFEVPQTNSAPGGYGAQTIYDYMGLPTVGQVDPAGVVYHSSLPLRAYNLIWNEWFRDQNLQDPVQVATGDGPDNFSYSLLRRGKRHDYFTSCLPWVQKGDSVTLPLGTSAPVVPTSSSAAPSFFVGTNPTSVLLASETADSKDAKWSLAVSVTGNAKWSDPQLMTDLSQATAATINQIRQAFQIQRLLERDARGGTRYTELVRSHFGVMSPDARLQRPEYLGGGSTPINIQPIAQTQSTDTGTTPQGNLAAVGTALARNHGFTQSFTEHGYVIGLVSVRGDLNYQQGLNRMWSRKTRYDFYWPVFANLGEQAVLNKEIYCKGTAQDDDVFGYQERWAEYRYKPSLITSFLRSTHPQPLDIWHVAQEFANLPTLNSEFIEEAPAIYRVIATTDQTGSQFVMDAFFSNKVARPLPMYSVPGLVDHF